MAVLVAYLNDFSENLGDPKETFYVGPLEDDSATVTLNQWPSQGNKQFSLISHIFT